MKKDLLGVINLKEILEHLLIYHYLALALAVLFFLALIALAIMVRKKHLLCATLSLFVFFSILPVIVGGYMWIEWQLRRTEMTKLNMHRLEFSPTIVLSAEMLNSGRMDISQCRLSAILVEKDSNDIRFYASLIRPVALRTLDLHTKIAKDSSYEFRWPIDISTLKNAKQLDVVVLWKCY